MYLWLKSAHVACVLVFVGGIVSLLLASAALGSRKEDETDPAGSLRAAVRWWDRRVTLPAMIGAWGFGSWLAFAGGWFSSGWLMAKLVFVVLLSGLHGVLAGRLRRVDLDALPASAKPSPPLTAVALFSVLGIVCLAIVKPG
ncbi:CopD family protein [Roseibium sp.]|uniref:CopD family protein n=1 Tax=Roseibium sp. TaxID=1936156 RepID=UPI003BB1E5E5